MRRKLLKLSLWVVGALLAVMLAAGFYGWHQMRGSLPQLDGERALAGLGAPVKIEHDALGTPTITGASRVDVARATGFVHAQDRFFQMDLLRRRAAGELAEIFGEAALPIDRDARRHGFRHVAEKVLAQMTPNERALLRAYTEGVNAGLGALAKTPWEYLVLRAPPQPWREADSVLCIYAMWFDLQDQGEFELNRYALRQALGPAAMDFLAPRGTSWDAALDGSTLPAAPLPPIRFSAKPVAARTSALLHERPVFGSNVFALSGAHTASSAGLLANDMHLGLAVPHIWYRAVLNWNDAGGARQLAGVMLPGVPAMVAGSNGHIAWGFTDAYVDTTDVIIAETDSIAQDQYRTPGGWVYFDKRKETIRIKNKPSEELTTFWSDMGPVISGPEKYRYMVLCWSAHRPEATNLKLMELETAQTTSEAIAVAHRTGIPNENFVVADSEGHIAWTVIGLVPRRIGFDGRLPTSWAYGDRKWDGWLRADEIPVVENPAEGALWSGNQRPLGGDIYEKLGDSGYDYGARAAQIRDGLRSLIAAGKKSAPADLFAIQLDDRALFLERWQKLLVGVLGDPATQTPERAKLLAAVQQWSGHASVDSAAYRIVKSYRLHVAQRAFAPFAEAASELRETFSYDAFRYDDALWQLVHEQPQPLLNPAHQTWNELLLAAADDVLAEAKAAGVTPERFTWGSYNTLAMQHPFSRFMPRFLGQMLDMPRTPLPGDSNMPRVQKPDFGQSERMVVAPGHEAEGILSLPGGISGHPLSPYYRAGHDAWARGEPTPFLPGPAQHTLLLKP